MTLPLFAQLNQFLGWVFQCGLDVVLSSHSQTMVWHCPKMEIVPELIHVSHLILCADSTQVAAVKPSVTRKPSLMSQHQKQTSVQFHS